MSKCQFLLSLPYNPLKEIFAGASLRIYSALEKYEKGKYWLEYTLVTVMSFLKVMRI